MNLYEIATEHKKAFDIISEMEGITDEIIIDTLSPIVGEFKSKSISLVSFFKNLEAEASAIKEAEKMMAERRRAIENKVEKLKNFLKDCMMLSNTNKISCPYFSVTLSAGGKAVDIIDPNKIPKEFMKEEVRYTPDKEAIKKSGGCDGATIREVYKLVIK